jgi:hypothetical protein
VSADPSENDTVLGMEVVANNQAVTQQIWLSLGILIIGLLVVIPRTTMSC